MLIHCYVFYHINTNLNTDNAVVEYSYNCALDIASDYPMTFPENPAIIGENYSWGRTFPKSPDEMLGYTEGALKDFALSGSNGSLYRTNPLGLKTRTLSSLRISNCHQELREIFLCLMV